MAVTIKTIANLANVSTATVSRYLNNPNSVSEKKQQLLAQIISEQNYKPNELARGLIMRRSNMVGVILPDINNIYFPPIMLGIEGELDAKGYSTFICNTLGNISKEKQYVDALLSHKVAGIIFIGTRPVDQAKSSHVVELAEKLPVVLINDYIENSNVNFVTNNESKGIARAVSYLFGLGHRRIAFLNGKLAMTTYAYKREGFQQIAGELNLDWKRYYIETDPYEAGGHQAMKQMFRQEAPPTAVVTANDQMAIGAIRAVFESGRSVPKDVSVVGFSNVPISGEIYPRLTTVDQHPIYTGKTAAKLLLSQIREKQSARSAVWLETKLVIRDSCAAPPTEK